MVQFQLLQVVTSHLGDERVTIGLLFWNGGDQRLATNHDRLPENRQGDVRLVIEALKKQARTERVTPTTGSSGFLEWQPMRFAYTKFPDQLFAEFCEELQLKPETYV